MVQLRECTQHLNNDCSVGSVFKSHNSSPQNKPSSSTGWLILLFFLHCFFFFLFCSWRRATNYSTHLQSQQSQINFKAYNYRLLIKSTCLSCGLIVHIAHKLANAVSLLHSMQKNMLQAYNHMFQCVSVHVAFKNLLQYYIHQSFRYIDIYSFRKT